MAAASGLSCALSLRCAQASASVPAGTHTSRVAAATATPACAPLLTPPAASGRCSAVNEELGGSALAGALFAALASSNSAMAAQEMINLAAADDNRGFTLLLTLIPAVGWVLFNILQPALNQLDRMKSAKGLAVGLGVGAAASLLMPAHADAAAVQEIASGSDSRGLLLLIVLAPAIGWVLFNILKPALNQLDRMNAAKGVLGAVGLSSALMLLCTSQADAAVQEISSLADSTANSDARGLLLLGALVPALGWVLFNILQPALNQFDRMKASKGIVAAIGGLGAAAVLLPLQADAVQELATVADNDSRGTLLLAVLIPAIGWVLFNILQPALNQFDKMRAQK